jgi:MFS family permease
MQYLELAVQIHFHTVTSLTDPVLALFCSSPRLIGLAMKRTDGLLVAVSVCTIFVMMENHYIRDTVAALEQQMESDLAVTAQEYTTLNSLYFLPNIITPLFIGAFCELSGRASKLLLFTSTALAIGNLVFTLGAHTHSVTMLYIGRFMAGCMYEVVDTIPIIILGPIFRANWGFMVCLMNGTLRFGTILAFAVGPLAYRAFGVEAALGVSSLMGVLGVASAFIAYTVDVWLEEANLLEEASSTGNFQAGSSQEMSPYYQHGDNSSGYLIDVRGRGDHGPTRKSIDYYQAMQAQLLSDPLEDLVLESARVDVEAGKPPLAPSTPQRRQEQPEPQRDRSQTGSHDSAELQFVSPLAEQVSPMGARFTARNVSFLRAEANAVVGAGTRQRLFSPDAGGEESVADLSRFGVESSRNSFSENTEQTPLLEAAGLTSAAGVEGSGSSTYDAVSTSTDHSPNSTGTGLEAVLNEITSESHGKAPNNSLSALWDYLQVISPFQDYGIQYYFYLLSSMCLFGAIVPFWFSGSKFLQRNYGLSLENSDFLMMLPEGAMIIVSPLLGLVVDYLRLSLARKLCLMGAMCFGCAVALTALAVAFPGSHSDVHIDPLYTILVLSACYACANSLTWDVLIQVVPQPDQLATATGLSASAANVLPSLIPTVIWYLKRKAASPSSAYSGAADAGPESNIGMLVLAATAAIAGVCGLCAALCEVRTYEARILEETGLAHSFDQQQEVSSLPLQGTASARNSRRDLSAKDSRYSCGSEYEIV